jgi:hypothetical protein
MTHWSVRKTLAVLGLVFLLPSFAAPQNAPVITNDTIGVLRQQQAGSIILPEGPPPYPAVIVLHGCNGVSPNTLAWARRVASWGYAALIINSFTPRHLVQVCDGQQGFARSRARQGRFRRSRLSAHAPRHRSCSDCRPGLFAWRLDRTQRVDRETHRAGRRACLSCNRRALSVLPVQNCARPRQRHPDTCRRSRRLGAGLELQSLCGKIRRGRAASACFGGLSRRAALFRCKAAGSGVLWSPAGLRPDRRGRRV